MPRKSEPTIFSLKWWLVSWWWIPGDRICKTTPTKKKQDQHHESDRMISSLTFDLLKVLGKIQNGGSMVMNPMVESFNNTFFHDAAQRCGFNNNLKQIQTFNPQKIHSYLQVAVSTAKICLKRPKPTGVFGLWPGEHVDLLFWLHSFQGTLKYIIYHSDSSWRATPKKWRKVRAMTNQYIGVVPFTFQEV